MAKSKVPHIAEKSDCCEDYSSRSVRKISNGYIISETSSGPSGYASTEKFSATPQPAGAENGPGESKGSLRDAIRSLKG